MDTIIAEIKFRLPDGRSWYITKQLNNKQHLNAFIRKMMRDKNYVLDEIWYK